MKYRFIEKLKEKNDNSYHRKAPVMVCLGDSVTQGCFEVYNPTPDTIETEYDPAYSYVRLLQNALDLLYPRANAIVINSGLSGGSAQNGAERLERDVLSYQPDLVTVCFGLNDATQGEAYLPTYRKSLSDIFTAIRNSGADGILITPNRMNTYISGKLTDPLCRKLGASFQSIEQSGLLARFVEEAKQTAVNHGMGICDMYGKWQRMAACGVDTTALLANHLNHPARELHKLIAYSLLDELFSDSTPCI